jgi:hypothetical protein
MIEHVFPLASSKTRNLFEICTPVDKSTADFEYAATPVNPRANLHKKSFSALKKF